VVLTYPKTRLIDERGHVISEYDDGLNLQSGKASERFKQVFKTLGLVNVIYGLMRASVLRRTGLIGKFIGADVPLVAELSLYGKFWEIPEFLFCRRVHPKALSSLKNIEQLQEFVDPTCKGKMDWRDWNCLWANCRSVARAPLSVLEKLTLGHFLLLTVIWRRRALTYEVLTALRHAIRLRMRST
jgi:hypothetical protein